MKYITRGPTGAFNLIAYEDYLAKERGALSACVQGDDLLTIDRFVPTGPGSLHDARFESILLATQGASSTARILGIELRLRGPYFDRYFELRYEAAVTCNLQTPMPQHDLLMHEVRLEDGAVTHELLFDKGHSIAITCRKMSFLERIGER